MPSHGTAEPPPGPAAAAPAAPTRSPAGDDRFAADLRGFGPVGLLAILVILLPGNVPLAPMVYLPVSATLALLWAWRSRTPWRAIGYVRPRSWIGSAALGIAFGVAFKFLMKAIVMPLLGADPINHAYHFLTGNRAMLPAAAWAMLVAGFGEETMFRGYAFERLGRVLGSGLPAKVTIVVITSALFGLAHYRDQGLAGAEQGAIVGLVYGTVFAATGSLFMLMCAHAAFDLTALGIIYWNLESRVAHLVFK
ncbi:MAG TPA: type II CAAX endopeptidase family protein [Candidatus Eisenbacteria bacterium]